MLCIYTIGICQSWYLVVQRTLFPEQVIVVEEAKVKNLVISRFCRTQVWQFVCFQLDCLFYSFIYRVFLNMIILLSPAKTLDMKEINQQDLDSTEPTLLDHMKQILKIMQGKNVKQLAELFKSSQSIAKQNHDRFSQWESQAPKQAGFAFTGQAYKPLDFPSLSAKAQEFGQQHLRILCGLYGVLKPFDLIKGYRLEMGSKLETPKGDLYDFWQEPITSQLKKELQEFPKEQQFIVNCASKEYLDAVNLDDLDVPIYNINFRGATVYIKQARGAITRYILENQILDPEKLKEFNEGWEFDEETSEEHEFEFYKADTKKRGSKRKVEPKEADEAEAEDEKQPKKKMKGQIEE
eukprot:TRINITY_DN51541_c0_g1_i6.p1 TRINITY_DN51541_c0_g1~~TRINITY_DN51541_c0_g1_i6.p1  ORF type:complete len:351 (-),score=32.76 TRINITY_DN51541_c0_g1_i6:688-1740(-)